VSGASDHAAGLAYRTAGPADGRVALLVHGYPESSYMWRHAIAALADAGWRAVAPDLPGYGDSEPDPPGTWEHHMEALERFVDELELRPVTLVTHDGACWSGSGGLVTIPGRSARSRSPTEASSRTAAGTTWPT
jgi:haloalkane dehalogenase